MDEDGKQNMTDLSFVRMALLACEAQKSSGRRVKHTCKCSRSREQMLWMYMYM